MKRLTVHSDGFGGTGTVILDEDGNQIEGVKAASIHIAANEVNEVTLEIRATNVIVEGVLKGVSAYCPACKVHLQHDCVDTLGAPTPEPGEVVVFKIQEFLTSTGIGVLLPNGMNPQGARLKVIRE